MSLEGPNLWLTRRLFDLGGVSFGDFTLGRSTVHSPVYVNPRLLIGDPPALRLVAELIDQEIRAAQSRKRPRCSPFGLVAGVPFGGLHLATAYALRTEVPMIYARPLGDLEKQYTIEGRFEQGQSVLIIDDLITTGGSVLQAAELLRDAGLAVRDVVVLVDREQGAGERLRRHGLNLLSILKLTAMLTHYHDTGLVEDRWYYKSLAYVAANQAAGD
ncbi:MAG: phosphoribosyltransferase [Chloroflexi bacterium]|nr:phosphoribosyltransferase [Chloroflexota bacterium]